MHFGSDCQGQRLIATALNALACDAAQQQKTSAKNKEVVQDEVGD